MKSSGRKRKDEGYFSILYGGVPLRVSILKENTKETYIRIYVPSAILYLAGSCLLSSAKGASLRCQKKRIPGKCKQTGAGAFERTIAGETHTALCLHVQY